MLKNVNIPKDISTIGDTAFFQCESMESIVLPEGLRSIGSSAFNGCKSLKSISIPKSLQTVDEFAFANCSSLTSIVLPNDIEELLQFTFSKCSSLNDFVIPYCVKKIESRVFSDCTCLREIRIPKNVKKIGDGAFYFCSRLTDVYYEGTEEEWKSISIGNNNGSLTKATIHFEADPSIWFPQGEGIYNLGEETYSFENYGDGHSEGGHCFGMSMTSSGYYNNYLNMSIIGDSRTLYDYDDNGTVRAPICHYQDIQGSFAEGAVVAGGSRYFGSDDIDSDWDDALNYVRDHDYDDKGNLVITFFISDGGHAVNFLRYEEVDGEERIYAYDNNFPETETYFYKDADGWVLQTPEATFRERIRSFSLLDVRNYFQAAKRFNPSRVVYAQKGEVNISGAKASQMVGVIQPGGRIMYELPEGTAAARIIPLTDNATFTYMDQTYTFGEIDDDTYGVLTLSATEDGTGTLTIENAPTTVPDQPDTPVTPDDPQPDNLCPWCGSVHEGFFQGIIAFFHRIFAAIFGARY